MLQGRGGDKSVGRRLRQSVKWRRFRMVYTGHVSDVSEQRAARQGSRSSSAKTWHWGGRSALPRHPNTNLTNTTIVFSTMRGTAGAQGHLCVRGTAHGSRSWFEVSQGSSHLSRKPRRAPCL